MRITITFLWYLLIVYTFASSITPACAQQIAQFPPDAELKDPTGKWTVIWQKPTSEQTHAILLKNIETGNITTLLWFNRYLKAMWAPDGKAIAITDYEGSSDSVVYVALIGRPVNLLNVEDALITDLGKLNEIYENGHRYFEALGWVGPRTLRFKVEAYDAHPSNSYSATFLYEIDGKVTKEP